MTEVVTKVRPVRDQIVAQKVEEKKTAGGIIIPDTADDSRPRVAKVLAVGPGSRDNDGRIVPVSCQPGDTVLFRRFGGQNDFAIDGDKFIILSEVDVLAVVDGSVPVMVEAT